jgi:DNA-directed RNA polymerase subunit L
VSVTDKKVQNGCSYTISFEDHTIGNLLWQQLLEDPDVLFAGKNRKE